MPGPVHPGADPELGPEHGALPGSQAGSHPGHDSHRERQQFARFTPNYASINRVVVARQGMAELTAARALKGHRWAWWGLGGSRSC